MSDGQDGEGTCPRHCAEVSSCRRGGFVYGDPLTPTARTLNRYLPRNRFLLVRFNYAVFLLRRPKTIQIRLLLKGRRERSGVVSQNMYLTMMAHMPRTITVAEEPRRKPLDAFIKG